MLWGRHGVGSGLGRFVKGFAGQDWCFSRDWKPTGPQGGVDGGLSMFRERSTTESGVGLFIGSLAGFYSSSIQPPATNEVSRFSTSKTGITTAIDYYRLRAYIAGRLALLFRPLFNLPSTSREESVTIGFTAAINTFHTQWPPPRQAKQSSPLLGRSFRNNILLRDVLHNLKGVVWVKEEELSGVAGGGTYPSLVWWMFRRGIDGW